MTTLLPLKTLLAALQVARFAPRRTPRNLRRARAACVPSLRACSLASTCVESKYYSRLPPIEASFSAWRFDVLFGK